MKAASLMAVLAGLAVVSYFMIDEYRYLIKNKKINRIV